jgi:hypothetical protein
VLVLLTSRLVPLAHDRLTSRAILSYGFIALLALAIFLFPAITAAQAASQGEEREPLGSLTSIGEVYVNESLAPSELTIFSGDRVRTGESGSATFNMSGKGQLKISPNSQVLFSGKYEYTAQLEAGAAEMNSVSGEHMFILRIGNNVVVPSFKQRIALAAIEKAPDGAFHVKCDDGAVGVLALQGTAGQFLEPGQSVGVSLNGALFPLERPVRSTWRSSTSARTIGAVRDYRDLGYIGLGGIAAGVAYALSHGGGKQSVSPSAP